ncbi:hypothetical protein V2I01_07320 [Micromonospora sp. BRA006-A]|nr:hypothetical protein [Micromonospora sp. BRA006-A]
MRRRPVALLTAAVLGAALAGCSQQPTAPAGQPSRRSTDKCRADSARTRRQGTHGELRGRRTPGEAEPRRRPAVAGDALVPGGGRGRWRGRAVRPGGGRAVPVVLFSHGLSARPEDCQALLTRWAAAGFVVAAPRFPHTSQGTDGNPLDVLSQPADVSYVLTRVLALGEKAGDPLRGRLDPSGWPRPGTAPVA